MAEAGIRELRDNLSRFIDRVREGEELVVTDRGRAVARIVPVDHLAHYDRLVEAGLITRSAATGAYRPEPAPIGATVSDLVDEQRR